MAELGRILGGIQHPLKNIYSYFLLRLGAMAPVGYNVTPPLLSIKEALGHAQCIALDLVPYVPTRFRCHRGLKVDALNVSV